MEKFDTILELLKKEVKPSFGCSGPIGAAIAACEAAHAVGGSIREIHALIDKDMCTKNSDVGIPPTGIKGMRSALLVGAICGKAGQGLNVLADANDKTIADALEQAGDISVDVQPDWSCEKIGVYTDVTVFSDLGKGRAVIAKTHSNLVYLEANGKVLLDTNYDRNASLDESKDPISNYKVKDLYDFAEGIEIEKLAFLKEAIEMNCNLLRHGLSDSFNGVGFGKSLIKHCGEDFIRKAKARTAAAAEARMNGEALPAMSCATSGNAGIAASIPIYSVAESKAIGEERMLRSLAYSYLVTISVKNKIGRHSAMCACVVGASLGTAAGITTLLGGTFRASEMAIQNTLVNVFGVLCDGARNACAIKLSSAAEIAMDGAIMALDGIESTADEGVLGTDADATLAFLGKFAREGMQSTDLMLCKALYQKHF